MRRVSVVDVLAIALAWVLWEETSILSPSTAPSWTLVQAHSTEAACRSDLATTIAAFRHLRQTRGPGHEDVLSITASTVTQRFGEKIITARYVCVPDTVDPRPR